MILFRRRHIEIVLNDMVATHTIIFNSETLIIQVGLKSNSLGTQGELTTFVVVKMSDI